MQIRIQEVIEPGCAREITVGEGKAKRSIVILRLGDRYFSYINSCPHTGISLNWGSDKFFDLTGSYIQCATHGALFEPYSGRCIWGPCRGQSLSKLMVTYLDGVTYIDLDD